MYIAAEKNPGHLLIKKPIVVIPIAVLKVESYVEILLHDAENYGTLSLAKYSDENVQSHLNLLYNII